MHMWHVHYVHFLFNLVRIGFYCCLCTTCSSRGSVFIEGGAVANLYAVLIARHNALPQVRSKGLANLPQLVIFQSERVWLLLSRCCLVLWKCYTGHGYHVYLCSTVSSSSSCRYTNIRSWWVFGFWAFEIKACCISQKTEHAIKGSL